MKWFVYLFTDLILFLFLLPRGSWVCPQTRCTGPRKACCCCRSRPLSAAIPTTSCLHTNSRALVCRPLASCCLRRLTFRGGSAGLDTRQARAPWQTSIPCPPWQAWECPPVLPTLARRRRRLHIISAAAARVRSPVTITTSTRTSTTSTAQASPRAWAMPPASTISISFPICSSSSLT